MTLADSCRRGRLTAFIAVIGLTWAITDPLAAVTHLKRGMIPPPIALPDLDGREVRTAELGDRTVVLVFGELYHGKTLAACADLRSILESETLAGQPITPLLIVARDVSGEELRATAAREDITFRILHDPQRRAFGDYRVAVIPSVVVVDPSGRVVHAMAGYLDRFRDIAGDAILFSAGLLGEDTFQRTLHPDTSAAMSEEQARASRLTNLGRQLVRRGLAEAARDKFGEALELVPDYTPALLGLGTLRLRRGRLAEAELDFRAVLAVEPASLDALLGLAYVQTMRGGDELGEAATTLHAVLAAHPAEPRAHYLMGLVHQQRNEAADAAASFRAAAEFLMSQRGTWDALTAEGPQ